MQSNSENSDFSGVDFAGIRALDPGGLYQVINLRNQEFIDHVKNQNINQYFRIPDNFSQFYPFSDVSGSSGNSGYFGG